MKVAIASSGLGHIARGIETWARETAEALQSRGIDVTLFSAAPLANMRVRGIVIPCLKRNHPLNRMITRIAPGWTWRWHLKSPYEIEQWSFWHHLEPQMRNDNYDILHVQDPFLAALAQKAHQQGRIACRCVLAHGTEEPAAYLQQFTYLQHLAPWHLQQARRGLAGKQTDLPPTSQHPDWIVLPNFVNTERFHPPRCAAAQKQIRAKLQLPVDAMIWGTAAAIKTHHKRIDWLIREFATAATQRPDLHLVIAGSRQQDTQALQACAHATCPGRITFMIDCPHHDMPDLLRALDGFVLTSLFEMMPIALLEAISTGLPVLTHDHPVLSWMAAEGGQRIQMDKPGALAEAMAALPRNALQQMGLRARQHAINTFSLDQIIPAYIEYYHKITKPQNP